MEQELELEKLIGAWSCLEKDFPNKNNPLSCLPEWSPKSLGKAPWQEALIAICCERKSSFWARTTERVQESRKHVTRIDKEPEIIWWHVKMLCFAAHVTVESILAASFRSSRELLIDLPNTHLINMLMPVVSIARLMPFHEATMEYFWRAVSGRRGSGACGAGGSLTLLSTSFLLSPLLANLPSSQPIATKSFLLCDLLRRFHGF